MVVTGINNVSVLESSFHGDNYSSESRRWANQERPITRTSFIRKMWWDLEGESRYKENGRQHTSGMASCNTASQCSCSSEGGAESEDGLIDANEVENECPHDQNRVGFQNGQENNGNLCLQHSPAFGVAEKQRVRQVFREWGSKSFNGHSSNVSHTNNCSGAQELSENECKRVRIVREWIESSTQQADTGPSGLEEQATESVSQIERIRDGLGVGHGVGAQRSIRRLYGRQVLLDLLTKFQSERKGELQSLLENRLVSNFSHRNRIQSLLRGRFLWNQRFVQDEKSTSIAASELGLLRQTHAVSDLRKGFQSRSDDYEHAPGGPYSDTSSDNGMKYHQDKSQEPQDDVVNEFETTSAGGIQECSARERSSHERVLENEERDRLSPNVEFTQTTDPDPNGSMETNQGVLHMEVNEESDLEPLDNIADGSAQVEEWRQPIAEDDEGGWHHVTNIEVDDGNSFDNEREWYQATVGSDFQESHEEWYENGPKDTTESWFGGTSYQETAPLPRTESTGAFYTSDDQHRNRPELRELMSRRRVSNLLQSDFRVQLNHLLQSYVERQEQAAESDDEWMLEREQQDQDQQSGNENESITEVDHEHEDAHPLLPASLQTHLGEAFRPVVDWQHSENRSPFGTEWEMVNGLRFDMVLLQERMNSMQKMLETCINMQLELKRSVHQEVSSALNRSSNSDEEAKPDNGKEGGDCFLCCDSSFESSPNRCGHVYVCAKCAQKINWSKLKESVRHP